MSDELTGMIAEAMCVRTWGHDDTEIPCHACRKEAALIVGRLPGSDELERLRTVNEAQAAALRAVRELATAAGRERAYFLDDYRLPVQSEPTPRAALALDILAILDGMATP